MESLPKLKLRFPGQRTDEIIQMLVRKHWIMDLRIAFIFLFIAGFPSALAYFLLQNFLQNNLMPAFWLGTAASSLFLLFVLLITYIRWLSEELDIMIVTNERLISHDQMDLFRTQISEASIDQVQDVTGGEHGILAHLLNYGSLEVQTSGNEVFFKIRNVAAPHEIARNIMDLRDRYINSHQTKSHG